MVTLSSNIGSGFFGIAAEIGNDGVSSSFTNSDGLTIAGNLFGTDKDGLSAIRNFTGLLCTQMTNSTIGGSQASDRNIFSSGGNNGTGSALGTSVFADDNCHSNNIQGNYFGTDITGNTVLTNYNGMEISSGTRAEGNTFQDNVFASSGLFVGGNGDIIRNNNFGLGADDTTPLSIGRPLQYQSLNNLTIENNVIGSSSNEGILLESVNNSTITGNYIGTDSTETIDLGNAKGAIEVQNGYGNDISNNIVTNNAAEENGSTLYTLSLSPLKYNGVEYTDIDTAFSCPDSIGVNTIQLIGSSVLDNGAVCGDDNIFLGMNGTISQVSAYMITTGDNDRRTYYVSQEPVSEPPVKPFSCDFLAQATEGTCDSQFVAFTLSGSDYEFQGLPSGVTVVSGYTTPPEINSENINFAGIGLLGTIGPNSDINDNTISNNTATAISVLGASGLGFDGNTVQNNADDGIVITRSSNLTLTGNTVDSNGDNGILLSASSDIQLGDTGAGEANTIANHALNGIAITSGSSSNTISSNAISDNGGGSQEQPQEGGDEGGDEGGQQGGSGYVASLSAYSGDGVDWVNNIGGSPAPVSSLWLVGGPPAGVAEDGTTIANVDGSMSYWVAFLDLGVKLTVFFPEQWLGANPTENSQADNCTTLEGFINQPGTCQGRISTDAVYVSGGAGNAYTYNGDALPAGYTLYTGLTTPPTLVPGVGGASVGSDTFTPSSSLNGSGVFINESSGNTLYNNDLVDNVRGIAISSSQSTGSTGNVIGGTGNNQGNSISGSISSGILVQNDLTQNNTITGNSIDGNGAHGIDNDNTHAAGDEPGSGDNTISGNSITDNTLDGIRNYAASPAIYSNTISGNQFGIQNLVDFGSSTSYETASDDIISEPIIGSSSQKNTINSNTQVGIYSLDTAPKNKDNIGSHNNFDNSNGNARVVQQWYGQCQTLFNGEPEEGANVRVFGESTADPIEEFTTGSNGYQEGADLQDVTTWMEIPEYTIGTTGTRVDYSPHLMIATGSAGTESFAFNGEPKDPGSDIGNIDGRYQIARVDMTLNPNTIQGTVFDDTNKDGTRDADEDGKADVTATIYLDNGNGFFDDDTVIGTATTDADGFYQLNDVPSGKFFVTINVPSGYSATTDNPSELLDLEGEGNVRQQDFGIVAAPTSGESSATIQGTVFNDGNQNAEQDNDESGIADVNVRLYSDSNDNDAFDVDSDTIVTTATTGGDGSYEFAGLALGDYFLTITIPDDYVLTTENNPTNVLALSSDGQTVEVDFGLYTGNDIVIPPVVVTPPTGTTEEEFVRRFIGGGDQNAIGLLAPISGAGAVNGAVATAAVLIGLANVALAVPGSSWPAFWRLLLDLFTEPFLALFGTKKLPWGRVFNSMNKQPLDMSLVRLYDANNRTLVGTAVTDKTGRFKFLPKTGYYQAKATKSKFKFPSTLLTAAPAYEKKNLYFGENFRIDETEQTFTRDIPLDPPEAENNIQKILKLRLKQTIHTVVAFAGIAVSVVNMVLIFSVLTVALFAVHVVLLAIFWRLAMPAKPKSWGRVYDQETKEPVAGAIVRIYDQQFGRLLDTAIADRNGKYGFLVGPSNYYMTVEAPNYSFPGSVKKSTRDYVGGSITINKENESVSADIPIKKS